MKFFLDYDFVRIIVLPVYAGDTGHIFLAADSLSEESVSDLPGKHRWVFPLVLSNGVNNWRCGHPGFAATNHPGLKVASFIIS